MVSASVKFGWQSIRRVSNLRHLRTSFQESTGPRQAIRNVRFLLYWALFPEVQSVWCTPSLAHFHFQYSHVNPGWMFLKSFNWLLHACCFHRSG